MAFLGSSEDSQLLSKTLERFGTVMNQESPGMITLQNTECTYCAVTQVFIQQLRLMSKAPKKVFLLRKKKDDCSKSKQLSNASALIKRKKPKQRQQDVKSIGNTIPQEKQLTQAQEPMLSIDKTQIFFRSLTGVPCIQEIQVSNLGSSAVYYEWVKVVKEKLQPMALIDQNNKFSTHCDANVIVPGQQVTFVFIFVSSIPGNFIQQYQLRCQPNLRQPLVPVKLIGQAYLVDQLQAPRITYQKELQAQFDRKFIGQIINDILKNVKPVPPPQPDLTDPAILAAVFQKKNSDIGLWFNPLVYKWLKDLAQCLKINWDLSVQQLSKAIKNNEERQFLEYRLDSYIALSKVRPVQRCPSYKLIQNQILKITNLMSNVNQQTRKQLEMWEWSFKQPRDFTEAQLKAEKDQLQKVKADWLKKAKKKKWGDQEEKALLESYRAKLSQKVKAQLMNSLQGFQYREKSHSVIQRVLNQPILPRAVFRDFYRNKCVKDIEIDGKNVLLRAHLQLKEDPNTQRILQDFFKYLQVSQQEQLKRQQMRLQMQKLNKDKKKKRGNKSVRQDTVISATKRFQLTAILDQNNLKEIFQTVKLLLEKQAKLIFMAVSFGSKFGMKINNYSLKFFMKYLKEKLETQILLLPSLIIQNFQQKIQNQAFADGSILLFENVYFDPYVAGFNPNEGTKPFFDDQRDYFKQIAKYTDVFVHQNKFNLLRPSPLEFITDQTNFLAGLGLSKTLSLVGYTFMEARQPTVLVVGGNFSFDKILMLETMMWHVQHIVLVGRFGICFYIAYNQKKQLCGIKLSEEMQSAIMSFKAKYNQPWQHDKPVHKRDPQQPKAIIHIPIDLTVCPRTQAQKGSPQYLAFLEQKKQSISQTNSSADFMIIDMGAQTVNSLLDLINSCRRLVLFESINPKPSYKASALSLFKKLFEIQAEKTERHSNEKQKDYTKDKIIFIYGRLQQTINSLVLQQIIEPTHNQQQAQYEQIQEKPAKQQNISLVQDFFMSESNLVIQLINGKRLWGLQQVELWPEYDQ